MIFYKVIPTINGKQEEIDHFLNNKLKWCHKLGEVVKRAADENAKDLSVTTLENGYIVEFTSYFGKENYQFVYEQ